MHKKTNRWAAIIAMTALVAGVLTPVIAGMMQR